jgi:hypothetical protein
MPAASAQFLLHCNLTEIELSPNACYEALSYVWGKDEFPETLLLPGGHLKITKNLASALTGLRMTEKSRMLWVDAVCINQSDHEEKGAQVARMASVYKNASGVIAWLGEDSKAAPVDMEAITALSQKAQDLGLGNSLEGQRDILMAVLRLGTGAKFGLTQLIDVGTTAARANFSLIYGNEWFNRMWIVQEAVLATRLTLCRGPKSLSWEDFERAMILLHTRRESLRLTVPDAESFLKHAWNLVVVRRHYYSSPERKENERFDFTYYIHQLRRRSCKDDRDRIYALKSLLPEQSDLAITPDYEKTVVQVFTDLALQQLQHGHVEILYQAGLCHDIAAIFQGLLPPSFHAPEPVPTWVPDYRKNTTYLGWEPHFGDESSFLPDTNIPSTFAISPDNPRMITTQCTLLDTVGCFFPLPTIHNTSLRANHPKLFFHIREFLKELFKDYTTAYPSQLYPNGEAPSTAFANALLGGGTSPSYKRTFRRGKNDEVASPLHVWQEYQEHCISEEGKLYQEMIREINYTGSTARHVNGISEEWYVSTKGSGLAWELTHYLKVVFRYHGFFATKKGYVGLAPLGTQTDTDVLVFIDGLKVPFVLRKGEGDTWKVVGPCYVHGMMDAQVARMDNNLGERGIFQLV